MGVLCRFNLITDYGSASFFTGDTMRGTAQLSVTEPMQIRSIYLRIQGGSIVEIDEGNRIASDIKYYLNEVKYLGRGNDDGKLMPGLHDYTFECYLPKDLPGEFFGQCGQTRYKIVLIIEIPLSQDIKFEQPFGLTRLIDLNDDPAITNTVHTVERKRFHRFCLPCCCDSEPLEIDCLVPVGGYVPGEIIYLAFFMKNESIQTIRKVKARLVQKIKYRAEGYQVVEKFVLSEYIEYGDDVKDQKLQIIKLTVPQTPPTDDNKQRLIQISYYVEVTAKVGSFHSNPSAKLPIIIGTIPIQNKPEPKVDERELFELSFNEMKISTDSVTTNEPIVEQPKLLTSSCEEQAPRTNSPIPTISAIVDGIPRI